MMYITFMRVLVLALSFIFTSNIISQPPRLVVPIGHTGSINFISFSPDSKKIVTASNDGTAKIWDASTGYLVADLNKSGNEIVNSAIFSPDGEKITTASNDGTAKIWDASTGNLITELRGHTDGISFAQLNADGKKIITASFDNTARFSIPDFSRFIPRSC